MNTRRPLFAVDVGNTRTKICYWSDSLSASDAAKRSGESNVPPAESETADSSASYEVVAQWLDDLALDATPCQWILSSVNKGNASALERVVHLRRPQDVFVRLTLNDVPIPVVYDCPERLGLDRAVAGFAGVQVLGAGVPFLVVDVGTAATIDYVDATGRFCGGAILPGPRLTAEALNAKTSQLPMLSDPENSDLNAVSDDSLRRPVSYPATETQKAIRLGVVYTLVGAVASFYWKTRRRIMEEGGDSSMLTLVLAGGNAVSTERNLSSYFDDLDANLETRVPRPRIVVEPRLVVNGLYRIASLSQSETSSSVSEE